jgi:hypothetical protein
MLRILGLLLILGLSSATSHASPPKSKPTLILGEMTIRFQRNPIAKLHADGRTESVGDHKPGKDAIFSPGPRLHADGSIDLTKGVYKARVDASGRIFVVGPKASQQLFGRIAGDELLTASGEISVHIFGNKLVQFTDGKPTTVLGVIDPLSMKRTALVMTAAFFIDIAIVVK